MAHELIQAVSVAPGGPVTIVVGQTLDLTAAILLNGPPPGSPTSSTYTLTWQKIGVPASLASQSPVTPLTPYTKTIAAVHLPVGVHEFKVNGYVLYDPFDEQDVDSDLVTVHVVREAREIEAELPDRTLTAGLPDRTVEGELPGRDVVAGLPSREVEGELPNRSVEAGLP